MTRPKLEKDTEEAIIDTEWVEIRVTKKPMVQLSGRYLVKQRAGRVADRVRHRAAKVVDRRSVAHGDI